MAIARMAVIAGGETPHDSGTSVSSLKRDFNIEEFFELAHRVIDDGDKNSMAALDGLKRKWEAKIGPLKLISRSIPMSVVENPWAKGFSLARRNINPSRCLLPLLEPPLHVPDVAAPLTMKALTLQSIEAAPNPNQQRAPPRVSGLGGLTPLQAGSSSAVQSVAEAPPDSPRAAMPEQRDAVPIGIFVGTVPLHGRPATYKPDARIADGFNNSSRKTLHFIPPEWQNGEVVVRPTLNMIKEGSKKMGINNSWILPRT
ncbi:UNVERIFIED_CONTAM: hypothetical protein Slati_0887600 [Sesamum latifolium]|uniref:Uncharacterized protein n=1 Tax=Sesamum latifolium TaxID=2727402 RepID=A0AAW2XNK6_9LAMI